MPGLYRYERLPNVTCFRTVRIYPGQGNEPLRCAVDVHSFSEPVDYEAVSYMWGPPVQSDAIDCGGKEIPITHALTSCFQKFRLVDRERRLWVDQVCINQIDIQERSQQVDKMREIYSKAKTVLVWLGPDLRGTAEVVKALLLKLHKAFNSGNMGAGTPFLPSDQRLASFGLPPGSAPGWDAVRDFSFHKYFQRIWIVQEVRVASSAVMFWGDVEIRWDILSDAFSWLGHFVPFGYNNLSAIFDKDIKTLELWLNMTFHFEATDPRDKVFALLGLLSEDQWGVPQSQRIIPDYSRALGDIWCDVVRYLILSTRTLITLEWVQDLEPVVQENCPRWASRFQLNLQTQPGRLTQGVFSSRPNGNMNACADTHVRVERLLDNHTCTLTLEGCVYGTVDFSSKQVDARVGALFGFAEAWSWLRDSMSKSPHQTELDEQRLLQKFTRTLTTARAANPYPDNDADVERLIDFAIRQLRIFLEPFGTSFVVSCYTECHRKHVEMAELAVKSYEALQTKEPSSRARRIISPAQEYEIERTIESFHSRNAESLEKGMAGLKLCLPYMIGHDHFLADFLASGQLRSLFLTDGQLGLGPPWMAPGDIVCMLFGGKTLFVLRPIADSEEFLYIGSCYVDGAMSGELVKDLENGTRESRWFVLR